MSSALSSLGSPSDIKPRPERGLPTSEPRTSAMHERPGHGGIPHSLNFKYDHKTTRVIVEFFIGAEILAGSFLQCGSRSVAKIKSPGRDVTARSR